MPDHAWLELTLSGDCHRYATRCGAPELMLPALANFVYRTWSEGRAWTHTTFRDYRHAHPDSALADRGPQTIGDEQEFGYDLDIGADGKLRSFVAWRFGHIDPDPGELQPPPDWIPDLHAYGRSDFFGAVAHWLRTDPTSPHEGPASVSTSGDHDAAEATLRSAADMTTMHHLFALPGAEMSPSRTAWKATADGTRSTAAERGRAPAEAARQQRYREPRSARPGRRRRA